MATIIAGIFGTPCALDRLSPGGTLLKGAHMFSDADIEQAQLQATANHLARVEASGVCTHGSATGLICDGCGKVFASFEDLMEAHSEHF